MATLPTDRPGARRDCGCDVRAPSRSGWCSPTRSIPRFMLFTAWLRWPPPWPSCGRRRSVTVSRAITGCASLVGAVAAAMAGMPMVLPVVLFVVGGFDVYLVYRSWHGSRVGWSFLTTIPASSSHAVRRAQGEGHPAHRAVAGVVFPGILAATTVALAVQHGHIASGSIRFARWEGPVVRWNGIGKYLSAVVVLSFFLPFFGISCDGVDVLHFSGADMAVGWAPVPCSSMPERGRQREARRRRREHERREARGEHRPRRSRAARDRGARGRARGVRRRAPEEEGCAHIALVFAIVAVGGARRPVRDGVRQARRLDHRPEPKEGRQEISARRWERDDEGHEGRGRLALWVLGDRVWLARARRARGLGREAG